MGFWPSKSRQPGEAGWRHRKAERYGSASVKCTLGMVIDMSATGMRLSCDKKPPVVVGNVYPTRISFDDGAMPVQVQVRWIKRKGLKRYELGLHFVALKNGADRVLDAVAKFGLAAAAKPAKESMDAKTKSRHGGASASGKQRVSMDLPDYYAVMSLTPEATPAQIKASYRRLAVALHPDRSDAPDAMAQFECLHEAYEVLSDPKRRSAYTDMIT